MKKNVFCLAVLSLVFVVWVGSSQAEVCTEDNWCWENPTPQGGVLTKVWGSNGNDIFAVETGGDILHYDGAQWSRMYSGPGNASGLTDIWGSSRNNIIAVGFFNTILHFDGTEWTTMVSPGSDHLRGVWGSAANDIYAVGDGGTVLHYDGSTWSGGSVTPLSLNAIWGSSPSDIYAVGDSGTIMHYNGSGWLTMVSGATASLTGVWGSGVNDIFAVGVGGVILHFDGATWAPMASGTPSGFSTVWGTASDNVFAGSSGGGMFHFDGVSWSRVLQVSTDKDLYGIWGESRTNVFAVGRSGVVYHFDGINWVLMSTGISGSTNAYSVWVNSDNDIFVAGFEGYIMHYDGVDWAPMSSGTTEDLFGVWGSDENNVFVVGSNGTILHYNGLAWSPMISGTTETLRGIWGSDSDNVYVAGGNGTLLRYDGTSWALVPTGISVGSISGVWGSSANDIFVVGWNNILHYDGTNWITMGGLPKGDFSAVWGNSGSDVFAVGYRTLWHYDGTVWNDMAPGTNWELNGVVACAADDVYAVGYTTLTMLHYDGTAWSAINSIDADLFGIGGCSGDDDIIVVGLGVGGNADDGTVARKRRHTVTVADTPNGNISSSGAIVVDNNTEFQITLIPDPGYEIDNISGSCNGTLLNDIYTTSPITDHCTVIPSFVETPVYTVAVSVKGSGVISPTGPFSLDSSGILELTLTPPTGEEIVSVTGCNGVLTGNIYSVNSLSSDCTVEVVFSSFPWEMFLPAIQRNNTIHSTCDTNTFSGESDSTRDVVEMGVSEGSFDFYYQTYIAKDRILIKYNGAILFDTGCVGAEDTVTINFSGSSSEIIVETIPNCDGTANTGWMFTVHCPK